MSVLIRHGTADPVVPIGSSGGTAETFHHAELIICEGAPHGWYAGHFRKMASEEMLRFMKEEVKQ